MAGLGDQCLGHGAARVPPVCLNPRPRGAVHPAPKSLKVLVTPSFLLWQERPGEPDPRPSSPYARNLRRAACPHVPPHSPGTPRKPPQVSHCFCSPGPWKMWDVGGCPAPQPGPALAPSFPAGKPLRPHLPLLAPREAQGQGGGPLPTSLPLPPRSPLCLGTSAIFQSWQSPGRRRPRACSRLHKQSGEDAPGAKALSGGQPSRNSESPRPFASPGTQRRSSPFSRPSR